VAFSLSSWRAKHLLGAWAVYWIGLVLVTLGSGLFAALRAVSAPQGHGKIDVSMKDGIFTANVTSDALHWSGSASLMSTVLWLCGPPLLLWLLWLVTRRAPAARETEHDYRVS
jgi:hypothetical protein